VAYLQRDERYMTYAAWLLAFLVSLGTLAACILMKS
jgi:hypothetical protein